MGRWCEVDFRGEKADVIVDADSGFDWETHTREIEWHFRGLGVAEHEALDITKEEEREIFEQLERQLWH